MHQWFRKGNARRFHRVDMPVRYFVLPSSPMEDRDIYATGADYFPKTVQTQIETLKHHTLNSLNKIQDQTEIITLIVEEIIASIEFYGSTLEKLSNGQHPKKDSAYWLQINQKVKGFQSIEKIKASSPKTYQYFKMIEDKYLRFLSILVESINDSDRDNFSVNGHLPFGFKLDEMMTVFRQEKFAKIPLIQTLKYLAEYMEAHLEIHRQINDDNYLSDFPQEWPLHKVNLSASGIAVTVHKIIRLYSKVDVFLYFEQQDKTLHFEGTVVDIRSLEEEINERIAINFEFPNGNDQNFLQQEIQKQEVKECMQFSFF